jgi:hypothetical protein
MITFRTRPEFDPDWTLISIEGEYEEAVASILKARLYGADWEIMLSRDGGEFVDADELIWDEGDS